VGEILYEKIHQYLAYIPVAIHDSGTLKIGKPVLHNPTNLTGLERRRLLSILEKEVTQSYLELAGMEEVDDMRESARTFK